MGRRQLHLEEAPECAHARAHQDDMEEHRRRKCAPPPPPRAPAAIPVAGVLTGDGSTNMTPGSFITWVSIGFGATIAVIAITVIAWILNRHFKAQRRARQEVAAAAQDARRGQLEGVQRMISDKRRQAAAARTPFLVVHPGGDAVVAFKENKKPPGSPGLNAGGEGLIKAHAASSAGASADAAWPASTGGGSSSRGADGRDPSLMGRRALVAAAALSGRTTSGLSDVQAEVMLTGTPRAVLGNSNRTPSPLAQQQQQQQPWRQQASPLGHQQQEDQQSEGSSSPAGSSQSLASQAGQPLLGRARSTSASPSAGATADRPQHGSGRSLPR